MTHCLKTFSGHLSHFILDKTSTNTKMSTCAHGLMAVNNTNGGHCYNAGEIREGRTKYVCGHPELEPHFSMS